MYNSKVLHEALKHNKILSLTGQQSVENMSEFI